MEKTTSTTGNEGEPGRTGGYFDKHFSLFREINKKYAEPQIKMTKTVRIALMGLRLYLIVLVLVLGYKFYTLVMQ
jgi:hypothetical protein